MSNSENRYFLKHPIFGSKEVTLKEWLVAERAAGFHSKFGDDQPATGGFSGNGMSGSIQLKTNPRIVPVKVYPEKETLRDILMGQEIL